MRQFRLIFLLAIALLSSGYRWRCYIFCTEQTGIQNDYVEIRDDCRDYADDNIDSAMADTQNPGSKKLRKSKLVELFSDCMARHGWDVPTTTLAKADDIPLYESSVSKVAAPAQTVPAPVIIDNSDNRQIDNGQIDNGQDGQTQQPADNSVQQQQQQEINQGAGNRNERETTPPPADTTSKNQSKTQQRAATNTSQEIHPEQQATSQQPEVRRQPAVTARPQTRETAKNTDTENRYSSNEAAEKSANRATNSYPADKAQPDEQPVKTAQNKTIYNETRYNSAEEAPPEAARQAHAASYQRKPLPHNQEQAQTENIKQQPRVTARPEPSYAAKTPASANINEEDPTPAPRQQAKLTAKKQASAPAKQEEIEQAATEKTEIVTHNSSVASHSTTKQPPASNEQLIAENTQATPLATASRKEAAQPDPAEFSNMEPAAGAPAPAPRQQAKLAARKQASAPAKQEEIEQAATEKTEIVTHNSSVASHSATKPPPASNEQLIAGNIQQQPSVTARKQAKNTQATPLATASRKEAAQPDPTEFSNMEPAAGAPAPTDNITDSPNADNSKNSRPGYGEQHTKTAAELPWKSQDAPAEMTQAQQAKSGNSAASQAQDDPSVNTNPKQAAENKPLAIASRQAKNTRKQDTDTGKPPARHIVKTTHPTTTEAAKKPAATARPQVKQAAGKADATNNQFAKDTGEIAAPDNTQQVFDSSLSTKNSPGATKNAQRSAASNREDAAKKSVAAAVTSQAKHSATAKETEISGKEPVRAATQKHQAARVTPEPSPAISQNTRDQDTGKTYITAKSQVKRTAAPVIDADAEDLPPPVITRTVVKNSKTITTPENTPAPSAKAQQAFDVSAAGSPTTHLSKNPATGQPQSGAMPSQPGVTAKPQEAPGTQVATLLPAANPGTVTIKDNEMAKRVSECALARSSAKTSSNAAARAKLCDKECAELLKKSPNSPRPEICPVKEAALDLLDNQLTGK